jgi:hypothetical protein
LFGFDADKSRIDRQPFSDIAVNDKILDNRRCRCNRCTIRLMQQIEPMPLNDQRALLEY